MYDKQFSKGLVFSIMTVWANSGKISLKHWCWIEETIIKVWHIAIDYFYNTNINFSDGFVNWVVFLYPWMFSTPLGVISNIWITEYLHLLLIVMFPPQSDSLWDTWIWLYKMRNGGRNVYTKLTGIIAILSRSKNFFANQRKRMTFL